MRRKEFMEKHGAVLQGIIDGGNDTNDAPGVQAPDGDTAMAMLSEMIQKKQHDLYKGVPEDTDWDQLTEDYNSISSI